MRIAVLSDIHGNREAFEAVLLRLRTVGFDRLAILGDVVGYGPDPEFCVDQVARLVEEGAIAVMGNHDESALGRGPRMSENAQVAIEWTRPRLSKDQCTFLGRLPLTATLDDLLFVHASAAAPGRWRYVHDADAARQSLDACAARHVFCGHTHVPAHYFATGAGNPGRFFPIDEKPVPLSRVQRFVSVVGAVGQPRDGNGAACFGLLDTQAREWTIMRAPYDSDETLLKIKAAGLPSWLGIRLRIGR